MSLTTTAAEERRKPCSRSADIGVPASAGVIRVFLVVRNRLLHQTLVQLFRKRQDFELVEEDWLPHADASGLRQPDYDVLVTTSASTDWLCNALGLDSFKNAGFKTVLIGMDADEDQFLAAIRSGVSGYLLKDASAAEVIAAVRAVHRGEAVCPPQLSSTLFRLAANACPEDKRAKRVRVP